ncbi:hypothetical protein AAMO2058_001551800 [Amorphochlora amoebiformis]
MKRAKKGVDLGPNPSSELKVGLESKQDSNVDSKKAAIFAKSTGQNTKLTNQRAELPANPQPSPAKKDTPSGPLSQVRHRRRKKAEVKVVTRRLGTHKKGSVQTALGRVRTQARSNRPEAGARQRPKQSKARDTDCSDDDSDSDSDSESDVPLSKIANTAGKAVGVGSKKRKRLRTTNAKAASRAGKRIKSNAKISGLWGADMMDIIHIDETKASGSGSVSGYATRTRTRSTRKTRNMSSVRNARSMRNTGNVDVIEVVGEAEHEEDHPGDQVGSGSGSGSGSGLGSGSGSGSGSGQGTGPGPQLGSQDETGVEMRAAREGMLGLVPSIQKGLKILDKDDILLKKLHRLLLGSMGQKAFRKHNIASFTFYSPRDEGAKTTMESVLLSTKWPVQNLQQLATLFGISSRGKKAILADRISSFLIARDVSDGTASAAAFGNAPSKAPRKVSRSSGSRAVGGTRETPKATSDAEAATKPGATKDKLAGVESKYLDKGCRHGEQEGAASDPVPLHSDLDPDPDSESDPDPDPNPTPNSDSQPNPDTNHNPTTQSVNPEIEMDALRFRQILKPKKPKPKHKFVVKHLPFATLDQTKSFSFYRRYLSMLNKPQLISILQTLHTYSEQVVGNI